MLIRVCGSSVFNNTFSHCMLVPESLVLLTIDTDSFCVRYESKLQLFNATPTFLAFLHEVSPFLSLIFCWLIDITCNHVPSEWSYHKPLFLLSRVWEFRNAFLKSFTNCNFYCYLMPDVIWATCQTRRRWRQTQVAAVRENAYWRQLGAAICWFVWRFAASFEASAASVPSGTRVVSRLFSAQRFVTNKRFPNRHLTASQQNGFLRFTLPGVLDSADYQLTVVGEEYWTGARCCLCWIDQREQARECQQRRETAWTTAITRPSAMAIRSLKLSWSSRCVYLFEK